MYAVFPELCNQLYVGYWKCPGLNDSSLLANSILLLTPLSYFPYWIWQIFSIFQPQLILLQIIPEIRWKKKPDLTHFQLFLWSFFDLPQKIPMETTRLWKKIQRTPKWNKKRVLFCSNNITKSQSFQFSQVLLTELSSLHACTIALLKFFQPVKRVKFVGVFHIDTCDLTQKRANTTLFSAPKAINWALTKLSIFYSRSVPGVHSKKPRCCCYRYPPCHANRDQGVVLTGRETIDVKDNYLIL